MERLLQVMATVAIMSSARPIPKTRVALRATSLPSAYRWSVAALALWTVTCLVTEALHFARDGLADQLWYASAVLLVAPFTAALGARRPGSRVWSWFVVLPATIVLALPAVTAWNRNWSLSRLQLEPPMVAGYALVLLMGAGNYFPTRFGLPALLAAAAGFVVVFTMSTLGSGPPLLTEIARALATFLLAIAAWLAAFRLRYQAAASASTPLDRLWIDFRDLFGIVWARRIADRINQAAAQANWPVRLLMSGFVPVDPARPLALTPQQSEQIEQTLRWLLRRFVDPEWIDERLQGCSQATDIGKL
jgi:hypothetical protein